VVNKLTDTTDFLTDDDEKLLGQIEYIKQNVLNFIEPLVMVNKLKEIIEASSVFSFKSKRNAKYISTSKPLFILSMDKDASEKKYDYEFVYEDGESIDERPELIRDYNFINTCLQREITSEYSNFLVKTLTDNEEFKKVLTINNIDPENITASQLTLISFVTAAIFGVTIELKANIIYLEYVI
jgi:hypothetical protein